MGALLTLLDNLEDNWLQLGLANPKSIEMTFRLIALDFLKVKGAIEMSKCEYYYYIFCYQPIALPLMTHLFKSWHKTEKQFYIQTLNKEKVNLGFIQRK